MNEAIRKKQEADAVPVVDGKLSRQQIEQIFSQGEKMDEMNEKLEIIARGLEQNLGPTED